MQNYDYYNYNSYSNDTGQNNYNYNYNGMNVPPQRPKKKSSFGTKLAKVTALGLAFGLVSGATFTGVSHVSDKLLGTENKATQTSASTTKKTLSTSEGVVDSTAVSTATTVTDVSDVVDNVMPAIVQVSVMTVTEYQNWFGQTNEYETAAAGSGIIISQDSDYLYIATNNHVVSGARELTITFSNDKAVEAEIQGTDADSDLAVVKVKISDIDEDTLETIKVATIGSSDGLEVGSSAIVIGNALGYGQSVTTGVISALDRDVTFQGENGGYITNQLIQTDAAVNPGNSGGALLNMNGEVIGVVSAKYSDTDVEGMGYAIPITEASEIITSLMNGESVTSADSAASNGAYFGINGVDINETTAQQYDMPSGVYVSQVIKGSGADDAGIKKGDVIVQMDGKSVTSMEEVKTILAECKPGDTITVKVAREAMTGYKEKDFNVTLTEKNQ